MISSVPVQTFHSTVWPDLGHCASHLQVRTVCKEPVAFMKMLTAAVTSDGEVTDGGSHRILHRYGEEEIGVKLSLRKVAAAVDLC